MERGGEMSTVSGPPLSTKRSVIYVSYIGDLHGPVRGMRGSEWESRSRAMDTNSKRVILRGDKNKKNDPPILS